MKQILLAMCVLFLSSVSMGQKKSTTFGIQYKPIIPNRLIGTFEQSFDNEPFFSTAKQKFGHSAGMIVRVGLTDRLSLETGLGFTQRNFNLNFSLPDSSYTEKGDVRVISYELPVSFLVYIRLADEWYMNTSLGVAMTMFPSDVKTIYPVGLNE